MNNSNKQSRMLRAFQALKSSAKFLVSGVKKAGAWLEKNGDSLAYVVAFCICLAGAFWAAAQAPLPVAVAVFSIAGLLSLAESV